MSEPRHANVELTPDGIKVWRTFTNPAAAFRAVSLLREVNEAAFEAPKPAIVPPEGVVAPAVAEAYYRCANGACDGD